MTCEDLEKELEGTGADEGLLAEENQRLQVNSSEVVECCCYRLLNAAATIAEVSNAAVAKLLTDAVTAVQCCCS